MNLNELVNPYRMMAKYPTSPATSTQGPVGHSAAKPPGLSLRFLSHGCGILEACVVSTLRRYEHDGLRKAVLANCVESSLLNSFYNLLIRSRVVGAINSRVHCLQCSAFHDSGALVPGADALSNQVSAAGQ